MNYLANKLVGECIIIENKALEALVGKKSINSLYLQAGFNKVKAST
jgi:hypothetical protein